MTNSAMDGDTSALGAMFDRLKGRSKRLAQTDAAERIAKLKRLYAAVYDLRAEIGEAGRREIGSDGRGQLTQLKPALVDIMRSLDRWMEPEPVAPDPSLRGRRGYVLYQPKGVVLHLSTWNAPYVIGLKPVMTMIAAGNAVVLKPSEVAPLAADLLEQVVARAGLDEDVAVVKGGPEVAQALLRLPFNHILYVGSNRVGRLVMQAAAEHFADVTLEMGGKNPVVVAADADLDDAASKIVFARQLVAGQACLGPDYVLVDARVRDALAAKLVERITAFYDPEGRGFVASRHLARIISERHAARIKALIDDAVAKGARVLIGGEADVAARFVAPTLIDGLTEAMDLFAAETFGPVLTLQSFADPAEAIASIERRARPLGFYVFTRDRAVADWWLANSRAGSSAVNNIATQSLVPTLPFGGVNHSGIGRLNGHAGFKEFSNARGVLEDALDPATAPPAHYPPFPAGAADALDRMLVPDW